MLVPRFLLTKTTPITIFRRTQGNYVNGLFVAGVETQVARNVNIQPLKPSEIMMMPEAERTKEWYKVYCAEDLRTAQEGQGGYGSIGYGSVGGWAADEFVWQGFRYRIMKVKNYAMGILNHHCAYAARIPLTPN